MDRKRLFFSKAFIFASLAFAIAFWNTQAFGGQWENTFGGTQDDRGYSVQQTSDGGYIIAGVTFSYGAGAGDVYLIKTDADGTAQWEKTFGGSSGEFGNSVQQTSEGGYIIAGYTVSYGAGQWDVYLIKTDLNGNELWSKTFGGSDIDAAGSVQQTTDGGYIVAGMTFSYGAGQQDVYLVKTDTNGTAQWEKTFGGSAFDSAGSVQQTTDGGYIITGRTESYGAGGFDVYLIKIDANGTAQWEKTFGGISDDWGLSVQQTTDSGFIIAGFTESFGAGNSDFYLIKTDANGTVEWENTFGGSSREWGYSVQQTSDGGYIIAGDTFSYGAGGFDVYLIKTDANGTTQWENTFGGGSHDWGHSVQQTADGGYIIIGDTESHGAGEKDFYLIYYEPEWELVYNNLFDSPSDLELLRQYRDEFLSKTPKGAIYKTLLYKFSEQALQVLLRYPELMVQAKVLIESNRDAVSDILNGSEGIIHNTDGIATFLSAYAKKSPPILKIVAYIVKWDMLRNQRQGQLFFGFRLK
jgi:hypothetical protein